MDRLDRYRIGIPRELSEILFYLNPRKIMKRKPPPPPRDRIWLRFDLQ